jgi:PAS domain S-box-containing protein
MAFLQWNIGAALLTLFATALLFAALSCLAGNPFPFCLLKNRFSRLFHWDDSLWNLLISAETIPELLKGFCATLAEREGFISVKAILFDDKSKTWRIWESAVHSKAAETRFALNPQLHLKALLEMDEALFVSRPEQEPFLSGRLEGAATLSLKSMALIPFYFGKQRAALLFCLNHRRQFSISDRKQIRFITAGLAKSIEKLNSRQSMADLYDFERSRRLLLGKISGLQQTRFYLLDKKLNIIWTNHPEGKISQWLGKSLSEKIDLCLQEATNNEKKPLISGEYHDADLNRWMAYDCFCLSDAKDGEKQILLQVSDCSRQKKTALELQQVQKITESSPAAAFIWRNEPDWPVDYVSGNTARLLGYSHEAILNGEIPYSALIHPEDLPRVTAEVESHANDIHCAEFSHLPYRIIRADGKLRWMDDKTRIERDADGKAIRFWGMIYDVTDLVAVQQNSTAQKTLLHKGELIAKSGVWEYDVDTNYFYWSPGLYHILGVKQDDDPNNLRQILNLLDDASVSLFKKSYQSILSAGEPIQIDLKLKADAKAKWVRMNAFALREFHQVKKIWGVVTDISEQKAVQIALSFDKELRDEVIWHSPASVAVLDHQMNYLFCSRRYLEDYRIESENIIGKNHDALFPNLAQRFRDINQKVLAGETLSGKDEVILFPDREEAFFSWEYRPWLRDDETVGGIILYSQMLTEQIKTAAALREKERQYRNMAEYAPLGICLMANDCLIWANSALRRLFGGDNSRCCLGTPLLELFADEAREELQTRLAALEKEGDSLSPFNSKILRLDGFVCNVELFAALVPLHNRIGLQLMMRDITAEKLAEAEVHILHTRLEQQVAIRTAQLAAVNEELEAFAFTVSHDLRSPLRAISGFSKIIEEKYAHLLDKDGQRLLSVVQNNTEKMNQLISDLLDYSKSSRIALKKSPINMTDMCRAMLHEVADKATLSRYEVIIKELPQAFGDATLMRQVWGNFLSNAIKYSRLNPKPQIEISAYTDEKALYYVVKDNGVGFNPQQAHKLFGIFQRLHSSSQFEGSGVGLAIVKRIITRHGGQVFAEGNPDEGASFTFSLPLKK